MPNSQPKVIVISGIMAAGKSTVAQGLAEQFERAVHVRGDVFRRMIVRGSAPIVPDGGLEMTAELQLRYGLSAMVVNAYAEAGYTTIVQDILLGADLESYVSRIRPRPVGVVVLAPSPQTVARREQGRSKTGYANGWTPELIDADLQRTPKLGLWLDTSDQAPEDTVREIVTRLSEAVVD